MRELIIVGGTFLLSGSVVGWLFGYAAGFTAGIEATKIRVLEEGIPENAPGTAAPAPDAPKEAAPKGIALETATSAEPDREI